MKIHSVNNTVRFNFSKNDNNMPQNTSTNKFSLKNKIVLGTVAGVGVLGTLASVYRKKLPLSVKNFFEKLFNILDDCI